MSKTKKVLAFLLAVMMVASMGTVALASSATQSSGESGDIEIESSIGTTEPLEVTLPANAAVALGQITGAIMTTNLTVTNETSGVAVKVVANFDVSLAEGVAVVEPASGTTTDVNVVKEEAEKKNPARHCSGIGSCCDNHRFTERLCSACHSRS